MLFADAVGGQKVQGFPAAVQGVRQSLQIGRESACTGGGDDGKCTNHPDGRQPPATASPPALTACTRAQPPASAKP